MTSLIARKSFNPRNGKFYSLRVKGANGTIEFARLRRIGAFWDIWAADEEEKHSYRAALHRHRDGVLHQVASDDLAGVLHYVRLTYEELAN